MSEHSYIYCYIITYLPIASLASAKLSPPSFDADIFGTCSECVKFTQRPFVNRIAMLIDWIYPMIVLVVHPKAVLHIGHDCCFHPSIRANNFGKYVILCNRDAELFGDADLRTIGNTGLHPKKSTRVCVNPPVDTNFPWVQFVILVNRPNLVWTFCDIFSTGIGHHSWASASYILFVKLLDNYSQVQDANFLAASVER